MVGNPMVGSRGEGSILTALLAEADAAGQPARLDAVLFGEGQSRFVLSCRPSDVDALRSLAAEHAVPLDYLGIVGGDAIVWSPALSLTLTEVTRAWTREL